MHRVDILSKHCYWAEKKLKDISEYVFIYKHYLKKKNVIMTNLYNFFSSIKQK